MRIEIINGLLIDPKSEIEKRESVFLENGIILGIGRKPKKFKPEVSINAENQIVCPGFIEMSAELNPKKDRFEINLQQEMFAAAKGGFTSICLTPSENRPLDTVESINQINQLSNELNGPKVYCIGGLTVSLKGEQLTEMYNLKKAGCLGVSNGDFSVTNTSVLRNALLYANSFDLKVFLSCNEKWLSEGSVIKEGISSMEKGLPCSPESSELIEMYRNIVLVRETGVRAHLKSITGAKSIKELIKQKKYMTFDVSIFHSLIAENEIDWLNTAYNIRPPLATIKDRDYLLNAINKKLISSLTSLHRPRSTNAKDGAFEGSSAGATSFETFLPLLLKVKNSSGISYIEAIDYITNKPAQILGLHKGGFYKNSTADICIFDPNYKWKASSNSFQSTGTNSPYLDQEMTGKVTTTIANGKIIFHDQNYSRRTRRN